MANQWFKFKEFEIRQDKCAMKVGTDGVILGAWAPVEGIINALDIGTGTGLIALMLAQRNPDLLVDAVEIESQAADQAKENVSSSKFGDRIKVYHASVQDFQGSVDKVYELIVCNPPYFQGAGFMNNEGRVLARHTVSLNIEELFECAAVLLTRNGVLSMIIPWEQKAESIRIAGEYGFFARRIFDIYPVPDKTAKRVCLDFAQYPQAPEITSMLIEDEGRHQYSEQYRKLTKDFYLDK